MNLICLQYPQQTIEQLMLLEFAELQGDKTPWYLRC